MFNPEEIIFAATTACNLHCSHCFVDRTKQQIDVKDAINFLNSTKYNTVNFQLPQIQKIGFSGGEPFLYLDFIVEITKYAVANDFLFDQIMTNGDWWKTPEELQEKLQTLYDAGYDGRFGISWDSFHGQNSDRMNTFISAIQKLFGEDSVNIQSVKGGESLPLARTSLLATPSNGEDPVTPPDIPVYILPQTFPSESPEGWKARRWFKDDFCEGPGQILYVHSNGNIAPCCGFANENKELIIGNISQTFEQVMENARNNQMIKICYENGLGKYRKTLKKQLRKSGKKLPGKTDDICTFCDFVCKNLNQKDGNY